MILTVCAAVCGSSVYAGEKDAPKLPMQPASLAFCGIRQIQEAEPNLTGQDVQVAAVCRSMTYLNGLPQDDYRFNMSHRCLKGSGVDFPDGSHGYYGLSSHATAIGGILVGLDPAGSNPDTGNFFYKGICPDASVDVYEFWRFISLTVFGGLDFQADVLTLSLGDLYEDWWTRGIDRLSDEKGILVVASAGNGIEADDRILYPAAEANVLAVGVLDAETGPDGQSSLSAFSLPRKGHSSYGPTADQRCKPDLVAPGRALVPVAYGSMDYEVAGDYSSLAAPVVSGTAALLMQKVNTAESLRQRIGTIGRNCVLKAILMTSAQKLPWWHKGLPGSEDDTRTPLDFLQGAGLLDAQGAYQLLVEGRLPEAGGQMGWDNTMLTSEQPAAIYPISISKPEGLYLTATIAWNRHYEDRYPFHPLEDRNSDLRLELWGIDPNTAERILLDISDSPVDTVEHIYVPLFSDYHDYELIVACSNLDVLAESQGEHVGLAWSAGADPSLDNLWWYDLNEDGLVDGIDRILFFVYDRQQWDVLEQLTTQGIVSLSEEQSALLAKQWQQWKPYLSRLQAAEEPVAAVISESGN